MVQYIVLYVVLYSTVRTTEALEALCMTRHVHFRYNTNTAITSVAHNLSHVSLGIPAASQPAIQRMK